MARRNWILIWNPGHFVAAGYLTPDEWTFELMLEWAEVPDWWPKFPQEITFPRLGKILPDVADEALVKAAIEGEL